MALIMVFLVIAGIVCYVMWRSGEDDAQRPGQSTPAGPAQAAQTRGTAQHHTQAPIATQQPRSSRASGEVRVVRSGRYTLPSSR